jgi:hypothetical protein
MKRVIGWVSDLPYRAAAAATVALMSSGNAKAADIGDVSTGLTGQLGDVGKLAVAGSFLGGLVMVATGLMKLKQASDSQGGRATYGEGFWRLAVGAGLVAVPAVAGVGVESFGFNGGTVGGLDTTGGANF